RMIGLRNQRVLSLIRERWLLDQRVRDQSANGVSGRRKLRRLRNRVPEDEPRSNRVPQFALPQGGFGRTPIRGNGRVGDREACHASSLQQAGQPVEAFVDNRGRTGGWQR